MKDFDKERAKEKEALKNIREKNPELLKWIPVTEDNIFLKDFGIYIPGKESFIGASIKIKKEDFIVEEISAGGIVQKAKIRLPKGESSDGETCFGTLVKCGVSTFEAVHIIAEALSIDIQKIQYAGLKDKEAITAQQISIRGVIPEKLSSIKNNHFFISDCFMSKGSLAKGAIEGNKFTILLRTLKPVEAKKQKEILDSIEELSKTGYFNFYYLQRFGTPRYLNFKWATKILKGDYKGALCDWFFIPGNLESQLFKDIRQKAGTFFPDFPRVKKEFEPFPTIFANEIKAIDWLLLHPEDYRGALHEIKDQVTIWIYALASLLFNHLLTQIIRSGNPIPKTLPLVTSRDPQDISLYRQMLEMIGLWPFPVERFKEFPFFVLGHREVETKRNFNLHNIEFVPEGIILSFTLGTGEYATTLLSHIVNLVNDDTSAYSKNSLNIKEKIGEKGFDEVLKYFDSALKEND